MNPPVDQSSLDRLLFKLTDYSKLFEIYDISNDSVMDGNNSTVTHRSLCLPIQRVFNDWVDSFWVQAPVGVLYVLILVIGLVANGFTLHCLLNSSCQLGLNVKFLISLTLSNLLIGVTSLPLTAVQTFTRNWFLGAHLCHFAPLCQAASIFINSLTLIAIAVERYLLITRDSQKAEEYRGNIAIVAVIWIFGILAALPYAWHMELDKTCPSWNLTDASKLLHVCLCGEFCEEKWPDDRVKIIYGSCAFALQFVVPASVMAFCYWRVKATVNSGVERRLRRERLSLIGRQKLIRRRQRTSFVTVLLFLCFAIPWLPVNILNLLRDFKLLHDDLVSVLFAITHLIAMTSILWNPFVYCLHNRQFFDHMYAAITCTAWTPSESGGTASTALLAFRTEGTPARRIFVKTSVDAGGTTPRCLAGFVHRRCVSASRYSTSRTNGQKKAGSTSNTDYGHGGSQEEGTQVGIINSQSISQSALSSQSQNHEDLCFHSKQPVVVINSLFTGYSLKADQHEAIV